MKKIIIFCIIALCSCDSPLTPSSLEQLQDIKKPAIVYAKHEDFPDNILIIQDADGKLITLKDDNLLPALLDKYKIGDTIPN